MIEIDGQVGPVAFLVDEKYVVSCGDGGTIQRWRVEDGMEVGVPMNAGDSVRDIAVSQDGKWIISGTSKSLVQVWSVKSGKKVREFKARGDWVQAIDVSPDSTTIASGSHDKTACVWSLSTGKRLLGPWEHDDIVSAVKFSPDGCFIATATVMVSRIYDSRDGNLVVNVPLDSEISCLLRPLAWSSNSEHLFAVSYGKITCLDASTGAILSQWSIHGDYYSSIALASDGAFIAASSGSSVSFWDTTTHKQIGSIIEDIPYIDCMAISANYDIVISGGNGITLGSLRNILPSSYCDNVSTFGLINRFATQ